MYICAIIDMICKISIYTEVISYERLYETVSNGTINAKKSSNTRELYHFETSLKGNEPCNIEDIDIDDMVVFRTV